MSRCELIKLSGEKCGSNNFLNDIYLRDGHGAFDGKVVICQLDSQQVFGKLREQEDEVRNQIKTISKDLDKLIQSTYRTAEIKLASDKTRDKLSKLRLLLQEFRNEYCRLCNHKLECQCEQCRKRHSGVQISSATLFSSKGYRRDTYNFHIICGRIFFGRFGIKLMPQSEGQEVLKI